MPAYPRIKVERERKSERMAISFRMRRWRGNAAYGRRRQQLACCIARARAPTVPTATAITRPACGAQAVERNVTSAGPVTKTTSSATLSAAKAVCRSLWAERMYTQRPRTMAPICGIEAPARAPHTCGQTSAHSCGDRDDHQAAGEREDHRVGVQHEALSEPVRQPTVRDGEQRVADDVGGRDLAGERIGTGHRAHQQDDPERHHRDRQPGDERGGREGKSTGLGEDPAVGGEHRTTLRRRRALVPARGYRLLGWCHA